MHLRTQFAHLLRSVNNMSDDKANQQRQRLWEALTGATTTALKEMQETSPDAFNALVAAEQLLTIAARCLRVADASIGEQPVDPFSFAHFAGLVYEQEEEQYPDPSSLTDQPNLKLVN